MSIRPARVVPVGFLVMLMVMASLAFTAPPVRAQTLFGATSGVSDSGFYSIDPATATATLIGAGGFLRISGMAFHPATGVLYAVGFKVPFEHILLTIDPATGVGTEVGPTNVFAATGCSTRVSDLSFRSDGTLYAYAGGCDQVGTINTSTGAFTLLGSISHNAGNGIAFSPGSVLYSADGPALNTLDQTTGASDVRGQLDLPG